MGLLAAAIPSGLAALGSLGATAATAAGASTGLQLASTALGVGSSLYGGVSAYRAGQYQSQVATRNADMAARQRADATVAGTQEESSLRMRIGKTIGAQRAAYATNGVDVNVGSPLDMEMASRLEGEADAAILRNNTAQQAYGFSVEEWNQRNAAKMARREGTQGLAEGILGAGQSLISGATALNRKSAAFKTAGVSSATRSRTLSPNRLPIPTAGDIVY